MVRGARMWPWGRLGVLAFFLGLLGLVAVATSYGGNRADNVSTEPIYIFGDAGFVNAPAVIGGTGTAENPYLIQGWTISTPEADYGIYIDHTTSHFVVRDCTVEHTRSVGIYLNSVRNGHIEDCTVRRNGVGIYLLHACDNILKGNRIVENAYGVVMTAHSCRNIGVDNLWEENGLDVLDRGRDNRFGLSDSKSPLTPPSVVEVAPPETTPAVEEEEALFPASEPSEGEKEDETGEEIVSGEAFQPLNYGISTDEAIQTPSEILYLPYVQTPSELVEPSAVQTGSEEASE